jgi:DNA-binding transcriptional LysR family regulator
MRAQGDRYRQVMSRLKLRHLYLIDAIIEGKSVSAAATLLNVTQPAISKGLREVEAILNVPLFVRGPKGLTLTAFGRSVVAHSRAIQSEIRHVTDEIAAIGAGMAGGVTVGSMLVGLPSLLPAALALMRQREVRASVRVAEGAQEALIGDLRSGVVDMVIGRLTPIDADARLVQEVLLYEPIVVIASARHPLARKKRVSYRELAQADWIFPPPDSVVYGPVMELFSQHGLSKPRAAVESTSYLLVRSLLAEDHFVAALPLSVVQRDVNNGDLTVLPAKFPHKPLAVGVTTASDRVLSSAALQLLACLREVAKDYSRDLPAKSGGTRRLIGKRRTTHQRSQNF